MVLGIWGFWLSQNPIFYSSRLFCGLTLTDHQRYDGNMTRRWIGHLEFPIGFCWACGYNGCNKQIHGVKVCHRHVHPWRLTWNIIMEVWKIIFLSKWVMFRFHTNLPAWNWSRGLFESYCCCMSSFRLRLSSHFQKQTIWSSHDTGWSVKKRLPSKNIYHEPPKPWKIKVLAT